MELPSIIKSAQTKEYFYKNLNITEKNKEKLNEYVENGDYDEFLDYCWSFI